MRSIVSSIGAYSYHLAKYLCDILKPVSQSKFCVKDSFSFVKNLVEVEKIPFMSSFDVSSLFTNIPLSETIEIDIERLYQN